LRGTVVGERTAIPPESNPNSLKVLDPKACRFPSSWNEKGRRRITKQDERMISSTPYQDRDRKRRTESNVERTSFSVGTDSQLASIVGSKGHDNPRVKNCDVVKSSCSHVVHVLEGDKGGEGLHRGGVGVAECPMGVHSKGENVPCAD
jgi:hypothetical protein